MKRLALAALLLLPRIASAFPTGMQFDMDPVKNDGAGGIAFTGSPRFIGHACDVCHTDPARTIGAKLESDHPEIFTDGWKPGMQYHLRVVLKDQHAAADVAANGDNCGFAAMPYTRCDQNGFALEIDNEIGAPQGKFTPVSGGACVTGMAPPDVDAYVLTDGSAATHSGIHHGQTAWDVCWTAPAAGGGTLTAYVAVVDGNGGTGTQDFPSDTLGDDVFAGAVPMPENGAAAPDPQTGGCSAADGGGVLVILAMFALLRRRRRAVPAVLAIMTLVGCTHVRPRERETLAKRNMKFSPDPAEDELDLHMQEAREGSEGGYGSSGGGCGCN